MSWTGVAWTMRETRAGSDSAMELALSNVSDLLYGNFRSRNYPELGSVPHIYTKGVTLCYSGVMRCRHLMGMFWCASGLGLRGIGPALAGKLGGGWSFRASRWGWFDRFLCLLRPDPAAASWHGVGGGVTH